MYTDPTRVMQELSRRRKDKRLMAAVLDYLGGNLPADWPTDRPIATINRYVATARMEDLVFAHAATSLGIRPFWPTYLAEQYTPTNPEKVSCLRPRVHRPKMQHSRSWLVTEHQQWVGQPLGAIRVNEVGLQTVHSQARRAALPPDVADNVFDISPWNRSQAVRFGGSLEGGRLAPYYYNAVMALYIVHGVLFEDFDGGPNASSGLGSFVDAVVSPAIKNVTDHFGLAPLIVRLPYVHGFLDFLPECGPVFDQATKSQSP